MAGQTVKDHLRRGGVKKPAPKFDQEMQWQHISVEWDDDERGEGEEKDEEEEKHKR